MPQANRTHTTPKLPRALPPAARKQVEKAIEAHSDARDALIAFLDEADPASGDDEDDGADEASLGWPQWSERRLLFYETGGFDDCEQDVQDEPHDEIDEGNAEPSLAHTNDINQEQAQKHLGILPISNARTWVTASEDLEDEHDGREPSLGAPERNFVGAFASSVSQLNWAAGDTDDRENDGDDREPDVDGEPNRCPATME